MPVKIKLFFIIGLLLPILLLSAVRPAYAIYSPMIAEQVAVIKSHVRAARQNSAVIQGGGDQLADYMNKALEQDRQLREQGHVTGLPSRFNWAYGVVMKDSFIDLFWPDLAFLDPLFMAFNLMPSNGFRPISTCMRNDIWELQDLKDTVSLEMLKAYLILDSDMGNTLLEDYRWLREQITILRQHADYSTAKPLTVADPDNPGQTIKMSTRKYLFGSEDAVDYYAFSWTEEGCPEQDIGVALDQVERSWNVLLNAGRRQEWGNIWALAQKRARALAAEWIRNNALSLTIGGKNGGDLRSLLKGGKGGGWDRFTNDMLRFKNDLVGMTWDRIKTVFDPEGFKNTAEWEDFKAWSKSTFTNSPYIEMKKAMNSYEALNAYQVNLKTSQNQLNQIETQFYYNLQFNSVSDNTLIEMDNVLTQLNDKIKQGFEGKGEQGGPALPTICQKVQAVSKNQCINKSDLPLPKCN